MENTNWLPPKVSFTDFHGNWEKYLDVVYTWFKTDFIDDQPLYEGQKLFLKKHPTYDGKEATFWHIISEGEEEAERVPDLMRCERIRWPRPIIEHITDSRILVWENQRGKETRVCIFFANENYLVVLARRIGYNLFWTAYPITYNHTREKLLKEYRAYKTQTPPGS